MSRDTRIIDEAYLAYVRKLPCLVCGYTPCDPDHLRARGWREAKRNDYSAIPLCRKHHTERGQYGDQKFCATYQIGNLWEECFYILSEYMGCALGTSGIGRPDVWPDPPGGLNGQRST